MKNYPDNQIYVIMPIEKTSSAVGDVLDICRKSLDGKFMVWSYVKGSKILDNLDEDYKIKLYSHAEILKIMATEAWSKKELDCF